MKTSAFLDKNDFSHADELLSSLLQIDKDRGGVIATELVVEFFRGYPLEKLKLLLKSEQDNVIASGIWIASELSTVAKPLINDIIPLIHHPFFGVRFFILDYLLLCAGPKDVQAINDGLNLLIDPHPGVRRMAMKFLVALPEDMIEAALLSAQSEVLKSNTTMLHLEGLSLLSSVIKSQETAAIITNLAGDVEINRKYAVAAAIRVAQHSPIPLQQAIQSKDEEIKSFAENMRDYRFSLNSRN